MCLARVTAQGLELLYHFAESSALGFSELDYTSLGEYVKNWLRAQKDDYDAEVSIKVVRVWLALDA